MAKKIKVTKTYKYGGEYEIEIKGYPHRFILRSSTCTAKLTGDKHEGAVVWDLFLQNLYREDDYMQTFRTKREALKILGEIDWSKEI